MKNAFCSALLALALTGSAVAAPQPEVRFVSFPDFFNFDIPEPWPPYEEAVDYFFGQVKAERPDFVLVCGDLVDGHWWDSPQCAQHMGTLYYSGWVRRMEKAGFRYYTAVGDHEMGDDPWPQSKVALIPALEKVYTDNLKMPQNGPAGRKGLAYYVREGDLLVVTVDTFEVVDGEMHVAVRGEQLEWFKKVLRDNADAKFKIVQGHVGIWGEIKARSSSMLMLEGGQESEFYQVMKANGVDAYFAGEFHDVTVHEADGIWEIIHGSSWGRKIVTTEDYLVGVVSGDELRLTLKRIYMDASGEAMWNVNKDPGPQEAMAINPRTLEHGPEVTGTLVIRKHDGQKRYVERTGYFAE